jgi:hypothetical protein
LFFNGSYRENLSITAKKIIQNFSVLMISMVHQFLMIAASRFTGTMWGKKKGDLL